MDKKMVYICGVGALSYVLYKFIFGESTKRIEKTIYENDGSIIIEEKTWR